MKSVSSKTYSKNYFLCECEGYDYWERSLGNELNPRLEYAWRLGRVKKGEKVLDFGCGRGELLVQAAKAKANAVGVDYSEEAISLSRKAIYENKLRKNANAIWIQGERLPFPDNTFDVVFFLDVAEHLYQQELQTALSELARVMKRSGKLIIHTAPNKDWLDVGYRYYSRFANFWASKLIWEPIYKTKLKYESDPRTKWDKKVHVNEQTVRSLLNRLKEAGFTKKRVWLDSEFRRVSRGYKFQFTILQPIWLPIVGKYFQMDIWAKARK
jgi:cyclopropane fatty-acyl-phospholipid synthase-like methyltransferase